MTPCEVCGSNQPVGVFSVPGVPYSAAYCQTCIDVGAHPWGVLVATTACVGSLEMMNDEWKEMVFATCRRLNKTVEEFNADVLRADEEMQKYEPPPVEGNEFEGF